MQHPLIDAGELASVLDKVSVLDVRYRMGGPPGVAEHAAGHVPGAAYVDLDADLAAAPGPGGRHPLPDPEVFAAAMRRCGVSLARPVVVHDDWAGRAAARCWWLLRHHGHHDVRVLDGGWAAWRRFGGRVEIGSPRVSEGDFVAQRGRLPVIGADDVLGFAGAVVDARAPERFRGEVEPVDPIGGHIPGAVNVPTDANLRPDGTFRPADELRELYPAGSVAAYCGSGVTATHDLLALAVAGREGTLYAGSWSEWVTDLERPVATGG